jgi:CheY-like chemotaxis protein
LQSGVYAQALINQLEMFGMEAIPISSEDDLLVLSAKEETDPPSLVLIGDDADPGQFLPSSHSVSARRFQYLILTSMWFKEKDRYLELGFNHYIKSPISDSNLVKALIQAYSNNEDQLSNSKPILVDHDLEAKGVRVLLAEDNIVNQKVISRMLTKMGCRVDVAANGKEAFEMWKSLPYHLILMDYRMPVMDGILATDHIRTIEKSKERIPIIAMTASVGLEERQACFDAGMDDYTSKPIYQEALKNVIMKWTNGVTKNHPD